jgi:hypothetical protein
MLKRNALFTAIAAAGCCIGAGNAFAATSLGEICGTTIAKDTTVDVNCGGVFEALTENCNVKLEKGANLNLNQCHVDADGYSVDIKGEKDAQFYLFGNGSITDASKIVVNMSGYEDGNCYSASDAVVYMTDYYLGASRENGIIDIKVSCGDIYAELYGESDYIFADKYLNLQADKGDVDVYGYDEPYNELGSAADGAVSVKAGGDGQATIDGVNVEAGSIMITSGGGTSWVGYSP